MENPFSLAFGKEPQSSINRNLQHNEIIESFRSNNPDYQVCTITGVRGAGKTVAMTTIAHEMAKDKEWIVINLNPERNLLDTMAAEIRSMKLIEEVLKNTKISLTAFGLSVTTGGQMIIEESSVFVKQALQQFKKKKKKVLVTIDEVAVNQNIKEFISQVQIYIREEYPIFLLMTGLFENIYDLQNEKTMTFLYRAPKIELKPLSIAQIADSYGKIFNLPAEKALAMAKITNGYPFAYQVLGYLCFKYQKKYNEVLAEYDSCLEEYVYEKIWSEMSDFDKKTAEAVSKAGSSKVIDIRKEMDIDSNKFNIYRKRLIKKGIIKSNAYGHLIFVLPRFREFIQRSEVF